MFNDRTGDHPVLRAVAISLILCMTIVANAADARYVTQASTGITNDPPLKQR